MPAIPTHYEFKYFLFYVRIVIYYTSYIFLLCLNCISFNILVSTFNKNSLESLFSFNRNIVYRNGEMYYLYMRPTSMNYLSLSI